MRFFLRDDDTCYFTKPDMLDRVYNGIWGRVPVSLGVIPFVGQFESRFGPKNLGTGETLFPLGDNGDLVKYLRELIAQGFVRILLHGYSHKSESGGPEFFAGTDLVHKAVWGKRYLEQVLEGKIQTFVPPHNKLSTAGTRAVAEAGMNVLSGFGYRLNDRPLTLGSILSFVEMMCIYARHRMRVRSPKIRHMGTHLEFGTFTLRAETPAQEVYDAVSYVRDRSNDSGLFGLATHYWDIQEDNSIRKLHEIIDRILTDGADIVHADQIWHK